MMVKLMYEIDYNTPVPNQSHNWSRDPVFVHGDNYIKTFDHFFSECHWHLALVSLEISFIVGARWYWYGSDINQGLSIAKVVFLSSFLFICLPIRVSNCQLRSHNRKVISEKVLKYDALNHSIKKKHLNLNKEKKKW